MSGGGMGGIIWGPGVSGASYAVRDVVLYRALRLAGITTGPVRTANPETFADALLSLNGFIDYLNAQGDAIFTVQPEQFTLAPPKLVYTIGIDPYGLVVADFAAPRPAHILRANLVLTSSSPAVYVPLRIVDEFTYSQLSVRNIPVTIPSYLYCDYDFPLAGLHLWGYPSQANDLELWVWQQLTGFASADDPCILPPGYLDMFVYNLAARLMDQFPERAKENPNVRQQAMRMLGKVKAANSPSEAIPSADYGTSGSTGGGWFNFLTGTRP
jgi:hypothetical protein